ncbi:peroxiredoxin prx5 [Penicillium argentinense]|uniref:Peroxiredoxin prx5 n=1 Tax=Penicillium argentinense TaxID=1131581 RepID=A0A9W9K218_9EURO|nr:peroxiredoxin prx5 [Penicillium argentinense]KAJ5089267.1 peroxiredoxin prx5 [Penicillium argentinense]
MTVDDEKGPAQDTARSSDLGSSTDVNAPAAAPLVVTIKTWIVSCIISCDYGLSFWPVPVMSAIGTLSQRTWEIQTGTFGLFSLGVSYLEAFQSLDYVGAFLFIGGAVPFLMGIVWAGVYDFNDAHAVAPLVLGAAVLIAFAIWETFGNLKYPLTPTYIFSSPWGRDFTAPVIALGVVNMFYYSSSILWPQMITEFKLRHWQWQLMGSMFVMVLFGSLLGIVTPDNKETMIAFVFLSQTGFSGAIYLSIAITQIRVEHKNLGVSRGISGCIRFAAGAVATSIYQTVYSKIFTKYMIKCFCDEGVQPRVAVAAEAALSHAYCKPIFVVAMLSMAFGTLGLAACLCCENVDSTMTNKIEVYLENTDHSDRSQPH